MNEVKITGRLGRDVELRYTPSGKTLGNLRIAHKYKDYTHWFPVVAWEEVATTAAEQFKKGTLVEIEGRLMTREWTDKNGNKRYVTEIVASKISAHYQRVNIDAPQTEENIPF